MPTRHAYDLSEDSAAPVPLSLFFGEGEVDRRDLKAYDKLLVLGIPRRQAFELDQYADQYARRHGQAPPTGDLSTLAAQQAGAAPANPANPNLQLLQQQQQEERQQRLAHQLLQQAQDADVGQDEGAEDDDEAGGHLESILSLLQAELPADVEDEFERSFEQQYKSAAGIQQQQQPHMHGAQPQQQQAQAQQQAAMHGSPFAAAQFHQPNLLSVILQMGQSAVGGSAAALDFRNYGFQQLHMHQQQHQQQQHQQQRWVPSLGEQAPHAPFLGPWQAAGSLMPWQSVGQNPGLLGSAIAAGAHAAAWDAGAGTVAGAQPALLRPPPAAPSLAQAQAAAPAAPALLPQQPQPASPTAAVASNAEAAPANPPPPPLEPAMSHTLPPSHREFEIDPLDLTEGLCIGTGSYGEVFKGTWRATEVAIKRFKILEQNLSAKTIKEFRDEVSIMSKLRHPNIVLFMGAVAQPSQLAIVTQFVPRGSLFRLLHGSRKVELDPRRRLSMAMDIAKGMEYLHNCKPMLVHRDLKSPNLLVDRDWTVKVCDFGLTRVMGGSFMTARTSNGTPEWMAPEVLRGERSDEKSDVWSYGVILYELVTGMAPWRDFRQVQVVGVVGFGNQRLALPNDLDAPVVKLVEACWAATPQERPSFTQVLAALNQLKELRPSAAAAAEEEARR